ncbi:MAG TPA: hypothetical protein VFJ85_08485 [Acidimicrobiales bacterium]|nr:hypothetical protein [Acidimicrobiales bacterium]
MITLLAQVSVNPTTAGMPGGPLVQRLLDWTLMVALWGSLGAVLVGAAMYGLARESSGYANASKGKALALGGFVGAILAGIAPSAVNLLFQAAKA